MKIKIYLSLYLYLYRSVIPVPRYRSCQAPNFPSTFYHDIAIVYVRDIRFFWHQIDMLSLQYNIDEFLVCMDGYQSWALVFDKLRRILNFRHYWCSLPADFVHRHISVSVLCFLSSCRAITFDTIWIGSGFRLIFSWVGLK